MHNLVRVGKIWHYRFQVAGQRTQKTTRERDQGRAETVARKAFDDAVTRANGGHPIPTLRALAQEWIAVRGPVVSGSHVRGIAIFARLHVYELGDLPIDQLTTERVELARNRHIETHSPATANHWLRVLKLLVNWAMRRKVLPALPWQVAMLRIQKRPRATLPIELTKHWFDALDEASKNAPGVGTAVRLMYGLGLRESEAGGARWEWIDWERRTYTHGATKGKEASAIPMPRWIVDHLAPSKKVAGLVATRPDGEQFQAGYARHAIRAANVACGIDGITPHRLRGSFATLLAEEGTPVQTIQTVMRHKDIKTTLGYLEVNLHTAAQAQDRIGKKAGLDSVGS